MELRTGCEGWGVGGSCVGVFVGAAFGGSGFSLEWSVSTASLSLFSFQIVCVEQEEDHFHP